VSSFIISVNGSHLTSGRTPVGTLCQRVESSLRHRLHIESLSAQPVSGCCHTGGFLGRLQPGGTEGKLAWWDCELRLPQCQQGHIRYSTSMRQCHFDSRFRSTLHASDQRAAGKQCRHAWTQLDLYDHAANPFVEHVVSITSTQAAAQGLHCTLHSDLAVLQQLNVTERLWPTPGPRCNTRLGHVVAKCLHTDIHTSNLKYWLGIPLSCTGALVWYLHGGGGGCCSTGQCHGPLLHHAACVHTGTLPALATENATL
jgi:hypothetical protein